MADAEHRPQRNRLVEFSGEAVDDLAGIYAYTTQQHGWGQAEAYADLIDAEAHIAADQPSLGRPVKGFEFEEVRAVVVEWPTARYAHYIVYRETNHGIFVSRILHSSMDIPAKLRGK